MIFKTGSPLITLKHNAKSSLTRNLSLKMPSTKSKGTGTNAIISSTKFLFHSWDWHHHFLPIKINNFLPIKLYSFHWSVVLAAAAKNAARYSSGGPRAALSKVHHQREVLAGPHRIPFGFTAIHPHNCPQVGGSHRVPQPSSCLIKIPNNSYCALWSFIGRNLYYNQPEFQGLVKNWIGLRTRNWKLEHFEKWINW